VHKVSYGCTGMDLPALSLKDPATRMSKLQGFIPLPGEDCTGYIFLLGERDIDSDRDDGDGSRDRGRQRQRQRQRQRPRQSRRSDGAGDGDGD
jgi:hypothetical protein